MQISDVPAPEVLARACDMRNALLNAMEMVMEGAENEYFKSAKYFVYFCFEIGKADKLQELICNARANWSVTDL